jgi:hypothetical protein
MAGRYHLCMATGGTPYRNSAHRAGQRQVASALAAAAAAVPSRTKAAAAWLFLLPLLAEGVLPGVVKLEVGGLAVLAFVLVGSNSPLPEHAFERVLAAAGVLLLAILGFLAFRSWPPEAGTARAYGTQAFLWAATYAAVGVVAVLFWDERLFTRVMWRGCTVALWAGLASCAASRLTGHLLLANPAHGTLRMVGTLTEPSDWAPILCVVLLLAWRRRSRLHVAAALAGLLLADSPTCLLVMAVTVPLYVALASPWRGRIPLLAALLVIIPAGVLLVARTDAAAWEASGNTAQVAVGRLIAGIQDAADGGNASAADLPGQEDARLANTTGALDAARANGWMYLGAGPDADAVYFPAMQAAGGPIAGVNALWVSVLVDWGEGGLAVLAVLMVTAAWRMRRHREACAVLLPSFVSSLVNSSIPDWSLVALGILLYAFGWARCEDQAAAKMYEADGGPLHSSQPGQASAHQKGVFATVPPDTA